jgi:copper chaperone CopZ
MLLLALAVAAFATHAAIPGAAHAADPAAPTDTRVVVHRITGLFAPDREANLRRALKALPGIELLKLDFDHAEATFRYDAASTFAGTAPDKVIERFDQMLREASGHTLGVKAVCATPRDKLVRVEILMENIDCAACCLGVYEILSRQEGVEQAAVHLKDGRASVLLDPAKTSKDKLEVALKEREVTLATPAAR